MRTTIQRTNARIAGYTLIAAVSFGACGGPMAEGVRPPAAPQQIEGGGQEIGQISVVRPSGSADPLANVQPSYQSSQSSVDPFAMDSRMQTVASSLSGDNDSLIMSFFSRFHRGGSEGVTVSDTSGMVPRTASEALANGGRCTDLAMFAIPILRAKSVPGGAMVVHFASAPANVDHMVPYVTYGGRETIVDLQAASLGQTAQGRYTVVLRMTYEQAASMYFRDLGDYQRDHGQGEQAAATYSRALQIFEGDAYVHQNLGILLERAGSMEEANRHFQRAAQLDPSRGRRRDSARGSYNEEMQAAQQAMERQDWAGCVRHLQAALDSGERISASDRQTIGQSLRACRQRAGQ